MRFGGVPSDHFPHAIDKSSGNGHVSSHGRGESLAAGFLLLDASLRPIYSNEEAQAILAYPGVSSENKGFDNFLQSRIRSVKSNLGNRRGPAVALLLERNHRGALNLERVARKFRLTPREKETVDLLLQDLSTKQIASRMDISANTAKAFLRSVMIKVGAENRTGIIGRILQASKAMNGGISL